LYKSKETSLQKAQCHQPLKCPATLSMHATVDTQLEDMPTTFHHIIPPMFIHVNNFQHCWLFNISVSVSCQKWQVIKKYRQLHTHALRIRDNS